MSEHVEDKIDLLRDQLTKMEEIVNSLNLELRLVNMFLYEANQTEFNDRKIDDIQQCISKRAHQIAKEQADTPEVFIPGKHNIILTH